MNTNETSHFSVQELSSQEQPREKLKKHGAAMLTDAELLAIVLRSGSSKYNVLDTARLLLKASGGIHGLSRKEWKELRIVPGIAQVKALTLEACFELSRRIQSPSEQRPIQMNGPEAVASFFGPKMRHLNKEVFLVCFLNNQKNMLDYKQISSGGSRATIVEPAEVMRLSILHRAQSIIVLHNHPSGNTRASHADIQLTKRIQEAGTMLGIPLDDHIIIAGYEYVSMRSEGLVS
jgi:DNA repair protein RadC